MATVRGTEGLSVLLVYFRLPMMSRVPASPAFATWEIQSLLLPHAASE